ncbi:MAG: hypothetical protein ABJB85_06390 [Nitrososphaerota archaeon]
MVIITILMKYNYLKQSNSIKIVILNEALANKVASGEDGTEQIEFAEGFGGITDLEIGPDGYLYVLIYDNEDGRIYRISPITSSQ